MKKTILIAAGAAFSLAVFWAVAQARFQAARSSEPDRPMGHGYHAMIYDEGAHKLLLFGGQTGDDFTQPERFLSTDVWAFDPAPKTWHLLRSEARSVQQPPALTAHAMAYDDKTGRTVVYGGVLMTENKEARLFRQTWLFDSKNVAWKRVSDGPPDRYGHRMVGVPGTGRVVLFGGACVDAATKNNAKKLDETWIYDVEADRWTKMNPSLGPSPRHYFGMTYDDKAGRMLVWGGAQRGAADESSIWEYDPAANSWTERKPVSGPKLNGYAAMAYDSRADKTILYGGNSEGSDETWTYDYAANTWTRRFPKSNPGKLSRMPLVYVPEIGRTVMFGGQLDKRQFVYSDGIWFYDERADEWTDVTVRSGEYFGQRIPATAPEAFAPALMASPEFYPHGTIAFSPDGDEAYWGVVSDAKPRRFTILFSRREKGRWTPPREAPFLGQFWGLAPHFSPDGRRLYFQSNRPQSSVKTTDVGTAIWSVDKTADGWSEPKLHSLNTGYELSLTQTRTGVIYLASNRDSRKGLYDFDLYRVAPHAGGWGPAERLGPAVNTDKEEYFPCIAPDESVLIFESDRKREKGESRLFLSFRNPDGSWRPAVDLSGVLGSSGNDRCPSFSPDGRFLFFCRARDGGGDFFWVDARIIDGLRPKNPTVLNEQEESRIPNKITRLSARTIVFTIEPAQQNTTIAIATKRGLVVVDTNLSKTYGEKIREAIAREFGRNDIRYVINTHEDWDHTGGNQAFQDADIIGHANCYKALKRDQLDPKKRIDSDLAECQTNIDQLKARLAGVDPKTNEAIRLRNGIRRFQIYVDDLRDGQLFVPPNISFQDRMLLDLGEVTLHIIYFGKAHRDNDIVILVPEEKLLIIGDLELDMNIVKMPEIGGGYESPLDVPRWLDVLQEVLDQRYDIQVVVGGHGQINTREWLAARRDYLKGVWEGVLAAKTEKLALEDAAKRLSAKGLFPYDQSWAPKWAPEVDQAELDRRHGRLIKLFWEQDLKKTK